MKMKKWLGICFVAAAALLFFGVVALAVLPSARWWVLEAVAPGYNVYQVMSLRAAMRIRDFTAAARRLDDYIDRAQQLSRSRNRMLPGLVEATELVVEQARTQEEQDVLIPVLKRLAMMDPELHLSQLWLARALRRREPNKAIAHADAAIALIPADERAYREGIEAALVLGSSSLVAKYCEAYQGAQFGGPLPRGQANLFRAVGLRKMAIEAVGPSGQPVLVTNLGIQLNERRTYQFQMPKPTAAQALVLHLGVLPGLKVQLHRLRLVIDGATKKFDPADLIISTRTGYIDTMNSKSITVISLGQADETINLRLLAGGFPAVERVELDLTFSRLPITTHSACRSVATPE